MMNTVLVLEDNPLIAMDEEAILRKFEAPDVLVANSVADAELILGNKRIDFALLDIELGDGSSEPIANRLKASSVPFAFVSGYDDAGALGGRFAGIPALLKPLSETALRDTLIAFGLLR